MIKVYRKTDTIRAEQFDGSDEMVDKYELIDAGTMLGTHHSPELYLTGSGKLNVGDWIATGVSGEHWTIADDVFKQTYAELPVIPNYVAKYIDMAKNNKNRLGNTDVVKASIDVAKYGVENIKFADWIDENGDMFARAWLDGYQVEEDK